MEKEKVGRAVGDCPTKSKNPLLSGSYRNPTYICLTLLFVIARSLAKGGRRSNLLKVNGLLRSDKSELAMTPQDRLSLQFLKLNFTLTFTF